MSAQHTPGPWFIWQELAMQREGLDKDERDFELLENPDHCIYAGNPQICDRGSIKGHTAHICDIDADNFDFDGDEEKLRETSLANARLIAAAPDLIDALKDLAQSIVWKEFGECRGFTEVMPLPIITAVEKARAAIAKAGGEA